MSNFSVSFFDNLKASRSISKTGVRHGFCDSVFKPDIYERLKAEFPDPTKFTLVDKNDSGGGHKRFYVGPEYVAARDYDSLHGVQSVSSLWKSIIDEVASHHFIEGVATATGVTCNSICNFGFAYGNEGCIQEPHLDGAIRKGAKSRVKSTVALLLYINEAKDPVSATELYDTDRKTILAKGTTMQNSLFFFEQHPDSWHGFPLVPKGHTRQIVSLSYGWEDVVSEPRWGIVPYMKMQSRKFIDHFHHQ